MSHWARRARRLPLLVLALGLGQAPALHGQQDTAVLVNGLPLGSKELKARLETSFWQALAAAPCQAVDWTPQYGKFSTFRRSTLPIRLRLESQTGPVLNRAGFSGDRTIVYTGPRYIVERVRYDDRLPSSFSYGYLATPTGLRRPTAAAIVLHGSGVHPQEAFGWLDDSYFPTERFANPAFAGIAGELADAGYVVFVPWIADDYNSDFWPRLQWEFLERSGQSLRMRARGQGAYQLLVNQVSGAIDLLERSRMVIPSKIAVVGWSEGAQIAAATAALDPRLAAVVQLAPPVDRHALRASVAGLFAGAPFTHADCALGDMEMAALIAPRPLLKAYAADDQSVAPLLPFVDPPVQSAIQAMYTKLHARQFFAVQPSAHFGATERRRVRLWLDAALGYEPRDDMPDSVRFVARSPDPYHSPRVAAERDDRLTFPARLGTCTEPEFTPNYSSVAAYVRGADDLRSRIARQFGLTPPTDEKIKVLSHTVVKSTKEYVISFVTARSARTPIVISGLLATPRLSSARRVPAVMSLDGNVQMGEPFGLPEREKSPYLNAYAERLAATGYVVWVPFVPGEFAEVSAAELKARGSGMGSMTMVLPVYWAGIDMLRTFQAVDPARIAVWGISYAGIAALHVGALDTRIATVVYSNPVITTRILMRGPESVNLAGWWPEVCSTLGMSQAFLIAPRRLVRENGLRDVNGFEDSPLQSIERVQNVYRQLGLEDQFQFIRHYGAHETRGEGFTLFTTSDNGFRN